MADFFVELVPRVVPLSKGLFGAHKNSFTGPNSYGYILFSYMSGFFNMKRFRHYAFYWLNRMAPTFFSRAFSVVKRWPQPTRTQRSGKGSAGIKDRAAFPL